jgi:DNA-binding MarR family transcriptional regulator
MTKMKKTRLHILMHVGKLLQDSLEEKLRENNIHHGQGIVLSLLMKHGAVSQADLARGMNRTPATLTNMLKIMEERSWIKRSVDPKTNRTMIVQLTRKGREKAEITEAVWANTEKKLAKAVTDEELDMFLSYMEALRSEFGGKLPNIKPYKEL